MELKEKFLNFIKGELYGWNNFEKIWLLISTSVILGLSLYWKENIIGIITAVTGVLCVIFTGKGKISSYIFGFFNVLLYAYISFGAKFYGEVMLNLIYYLPMNFVGWIMWKKHMNGSTKEVVKRRLSNKCKIIIIVLCSTSIYGYGLFLKSLGGSLPFVDSISTVISIFAQILCVKRYSEQWILWIIVNIVTICLWVGAFFTGGQSIATLIMWSIYLINAIIMFVKWNNESKLQEVKEEVKYV